jgi:hypothetical protein
MATYLDADEGLFEIAEAFFITALGLWPFLLFFRLSSSIRLPIIACRILDFGVNQPSGVCLSIGKESSPHPLVRKHMQFVDNFRDALKLPTTGNLVCISPNITKHVGLSIIDSLKASLSQSFVTGPRREQLQSSGSSNLYFKRRVFILPLKPTCHAIATQRQRAGEIRAVVNIARRETSLHSSFAAGRQNLRKTTDRLKEVARELTNLRCLFSDRTA